MKKVVSSIVLLMCLLSFQTQGQQSHIDIPQKNLSDANIYGHVIDKDTGERLPFVHIIIKGTNIGVATDETGHYMIVDVPEGKHIVTTQSVGYKSQEKEVVFKKGVSTEVNFELKQDFINVEGVVVTADRNKKNRKEATSIVNVLGAKMLAKTQSINLAEGLNFQPGLRVETDCQNCGFTQLRMNGLEGPYTQILIDGHPIMSGLAGVYGLDQVPASMIDRIEVVRGGGSVLYGGNAIAGTVNVITKEPTKRTFEATYSKGILSKDSQDDLFTFNNSYISKDYNTGLYLFAQYRNRDHFNSNPDDMWDADGDGIAETKDDFSEISAIEAGSFGARAFHRFNQYNKIKMEYHHLGEFRRGGNKFELQPHQTDIAEQIRTSVNGGSATYDWLSKDYKHHVSLFNSLQKINRHSYYGVEQDMNAYGVTDEITNVAGAQYTGYFNKLLFAKSTLVGGVEYTYSDLHDNKIQYEENNSVPIIAQEYTNLGAFVENEWNMNAIRFKAGVRMDKHSLMDKMIVSPRASFLADITGTTQLRLSYAQGFRAPQVFDEDLHIEVAGAQTILTRNSDDLKEERSQSFSLSIDNTNMFGEWQTYILVDGFYTILQDAFVKTIEIDNEGNAFLERTNGSGAKVYGLNIEGKLAPSNNLNFTLGWTLQQSKYDKNEEVWASEDGSEVIETKNILRTPDNYGYIVCTYNPSHHWELSLNGTFTGSMKVPHMVDPDTERTIIKESPNFFDLGTKIEYHIDIKHDRKLVFFAGAKNVLNQYQDDFDAGLNRDAGYVYGPGLPRMFFFGIKLKN